MNVKDLKCYPQVAAVIGEAFAGYELQRVIDCPDCQVRINGEDLFNSFDWDDSPQGGNFWGLIDKGLNPYDHGHKKPEVKEWVYIDERWLQSKNGDFLNGKGLKCPISDLSNIIDVKEDVTMPNLVPELSEKTPTNSGKDKAMTKEEVKAFVGDLTALGPNNHIPNYKIGEKESNLFFCTKQPTAASILESGLGHMKDRAVTYDNPQDERSMGKTVDMFNILYGLELTEEQGRAFMELLKLVRTSQGEFKLDNYEDMAAYAGLMGEAAAKGKSNE